MKQNANFIEVLIEHVSSIPMSHVANTLYSRLYKLKPLLCQYILFRLDKLKPFLISTHFDKPKPMDSYIHCAQQVDRFIVDIVDNHVYFTIYL